MSRASELLRLISETSGEELEYQYLGREDGETVVVDDEYDAHRFDSKDYARTAARPYKGYVIDKLTDREGEEYWIVKIPDVSGGDASLESRVANAIDYFYRNNKEDINVVSNYSGRGMFGSQCVGVIISSDDWDSSLAYLQQVKLTPKTDDMGLDGIVYWPTVKYEDIKELLTDSIPVDQN